MHPVLKHLTRPAVLVGLFVFAANVGATAAVDNCYPPIAPAAAPGTTVIVLVDRTTPITSAWADMRRRIMGTLQPAEYRVLAFDGPQLRTLMQVTLQYPPTPAQTEAMPIKRTREVRACLQRQARKAAQLIGDTLDAIEQAGVSDAPFSEISYAVRETLRQTARPGQRVKLVVHSDGLEHAQAGASFYAKRLPRAVMPTAELERLPEAVKQPPVAAALRDSITITWFGLGAHDKQAAPYGAAAMASWQEFWSALLVRQWGLPNVQVGGTVLEPAAMR